MIHLRLIHCEILVRIIETSSVYFLYHICPGDFMEIPYGRVAAAEGFLLHTWEVNEILCLSIVILRQTPDIWIIGFFLSMMLKSSTGRLSFRIFFRVPVQIAFCILIDRCMALTWRLLPFSLQASSVFSSPRASTSPSLSSVDQITNTPLLYYFFLSNWSLDWGLMRKVILLTVSVLNIRGAFSLL